MEHPSGQPSPQPMGETSYHYPDAVRPDILRMIPPDGREIGSIGCGYAPTEASLVRDGRLVHGVDMSPEAIAVASQRLTSARVVSPEEREPFARDSLDGLILADILEHIPQAWDALAAFARAVRPGGWVVISVPNMRSFKVIATLIFAGDWPEEPQGIFDRTHLQVMSKRRLERWAAGANLKPVRWFDQYALGGSRQKMLSWLDHATFRLFHEFTQHRLMVLCRRQPASDAASSESKTRAD